MNTKEYQGIFNILPKCSEFENINQFPFFKNKVWIVCDLLKKQDPEAAQNICWGLAEAIGFVFLEKKHSVKVIPSAFAKIAFELFSKNEKDMAEQYVSINGNMNTSTDDVSDVVNLLYDIDFLLETIMKEQNEVVETFKRNGKNDAVDEKGIIEEIREWALENH